MSYGGITGQAPDLNEYLPKSGGTMTGPLILSGNPSSNLEAASKRYVDSKASGFEADWKLLKSGTLQFSRTYSGYESQYLTYNTSLFDNCRAVKVKIKWYVNLKTNSAGQDAGHQISFEQASGNSDLYFVIGPNKTVNSGPYDSYKIYNNAFSRLGESPNYFSRIVFAGEDNSRFEVNGQFEARLEIDSRSEKFIYNNSQAVVEIYGKF